ncbi:MAG: hypothetical protein EA351_13905 [Gemmatimonadales bacterium]|nr:MAG: hypothetical protein EA351_13905 [Gemmatimonadales bacterium]
MADVPQIFRKTPPQFRGEPILPFKGDRIMSVTRILALFLALAFFLPACGLSSPTDLPVDDGVQMEAAFDQQNGDDDDDGCEEDEDGEVTCGFGGFLGSGG